MLAPFLFILFGEALSSFLRSSMAVIQAIALPIALSTILDAKFAHETALYIHVDVIDLHLVENALQIFSNVIEASLNWNKFVGL